MPRGAATTRPQRARKVQNYAELAAGNFDSDKSEEKGLENDLKFYRAPITGLRGRRGSNGESQGPATAPRNPRKGIPGGGDTVWSSPSQPKVHFPYTLRQQGNLLHATRTVSSHPSLGDQTIAYLEGSTNQPTSRSLTNPVPSTAHYE